MPNKKIMFKAVLTGTVVSLAASAVLLCVLSAVQLTSGLFPTEIVRAAGIAVLASGTLLGGIVAARITKSGGMVTGLITGAVVFLLVTAAALLSSGESVSVTTAIRFLCEAVFGALGGIIGVNKKEKLHIK